jgi:hypothetical protein
MDSALSVPSLHALPKDRHAINGPDASLPFAANVIDPSTETGKSDGDAMNGANGVSVSKILPVVAAASEGNSGVHDDEDDDDEEQRSKRRKLHRLAKLERRQERQRRESEQMFSYSRSIFPVREWQFYLPFDMSPYPIVINPLVTAVAVAWLWGLVIWSAGTYFITDSIPRKFTHFLQQSQSYFPMMQSTPTTLYRHWWRFAPILLQPRRGSFKAARGSLSCSMFTLCIVLVTYTLDADNQCHAHKLPNPVTAART